MAQQDPNTTLAPDDDDPQQAATDGADDGDTEPDTSSSEPTDWETRYRDLQSFKDRQIADLRAQLEARGQSRQQPDDSDQADGAQYEQESWQLAEAVHGPEAVAALESVGPLLSAAQTPADLVTALEAYHQARQGGASPAQAADTAGQQAPAQARPPMPRVDQDAAQSPDLDSIDKQIEEAKGRGQAGLGDWIRLQRQQRGW